MAIEPIDLRSIKGRESQANPFYRSLPGYERFIECSQADVLPLIAEVERLASAAMTLEVQLAAERERCAMICDEMASGGLLESCNYALQDAAAEIRKGA